MNDPDIVTRLRDCTCVPHGELCREAADEIERQTEIIVTLRQELKEAKARNTMYLSKIQECEVREI